MASVNRVILIGHLGRDPETRYMPDGTAVTNASIATTEQWTDKASGEKKEATEWHRLQFWGRLGEIAGEYLKKGAMIYVEGKLQTRKWQDKDGIDRYTTEVRADVLKMLGRAGDARQENETQDRTDTQTDAKRGEKKAGGGKHFDDMEDEIPF